MLDKALAFFLYSLFFFNSDYNSPGYSDKFYGILPPGDIDGYSRFRAFMLRHPLMFRVIRKIKHKLSHNGIHMRTEAQNHKDNLPSTVRTWISEFNLKDLKDASQAKAHAEAFREKINVLSEEIEYCHAHQWHPVFVIPPIPEVTRSHISNEFIKAFTHENIKVLTDKYPDVKVLNYYDDSRITPEMFANDVFMNEKGRETFSGILFSDIEKERANYGTGN